MSEVATLLPSPTYARVAPRTSPSRSRRVRQSARAWHGCSSLVNAFTTRSRVVARAISRSLDCWNVRMAATEIHRSRVRATSARASRVPSASADGGHVTMPPSSCIAISNPVRVRSDGLSNSRASECPASARLVGASAPIPRSRFSFAARARHVSSPSGVRSSTDR